MSDTPRTDSIEPRVLQRYQQAEDILAEDNAKIAIGEMAYFARELERQNAALQARLDACVKALANLPQARNFKPGHFSDLSYQEQSRIPSGVPFSVSLPVYNGSEIRAWADDIIALATVPHAAAKEQRNKQ